MQAVTVFEVAASRGEAGLARELHALAAPSYVDPSALLGAAWGHSSHLYVARDDAGRVATFFFASFEHLDLEGGRADAVYMGLSATRRDLKGSGVVKRVFDRFVEDARAWERRHARPLLLWGKTATPTMFRGIRAVFPDLEPGLDGSFTDLGAQVARAARRAHGLPEHLPGVHPFVLPGVVAADTRYSAEEHARIASRTASRGTLLERLGVDERRGDRIVIFSRVPPERRPAASRARPD